MKEDFLSHLSEKHQSCQKCVSLSEINSFLQHLIGILFPERSVFPISNSIELREQLEVVKQKLSDLVTIRKGDYDGVLTSFFDQLPATYELLLKDVEAIYQGDPAAKSKREIIYSYPGFYSIAAYRIAHLLHILKVPDLPRAITEIAHSKTGIDIHPGAKIGESFCIDHGTGVVIGETTVIGNSVKLYQGVTLGALSIDARTSEAKRHPTIEDQVVLYAGATILGGTTTVGKGSVIGGNVWLTKSIPPKSTVYYQTRMIHGNGEDDIIKIKKAF